MNTEQQILVKRMTEAGLPLNRFFEVTLDKKPKEAKGYTERLRNPEEMDKAGIKNWGLISTKVDELTLIDCDESKLYEELSKGLPETFEVLSARRKLPHKYYIVTGEKVQNAVFTLGEKNEKGQLKGCGELRANNYYCVAPGTYVDFWDKGVHVKGTYTILKDRPITKIEYSEFMKIIQPFLKQKGKDLKITMEEITKGVGSGYRHFYGIRMACYLKGVQKLDRASALTALKLWNEKNDPPMGENDLEHIINCAEGYLPDINPIEAKNSLAEFATDPLLLKQILTDLERTVKNDVPSKVCVLMTGLSTYSAAINTNFKSESGSGKTYITTEVIDYFPTEDVWFIGGMTPKAIIREKGILMNANGEEFTLEYPKKPVRMDFKNGNKIDKEAYNNAEKEYEEKLKEYLKELNGSYNLVDLTGKILLFLETPSYETIDMLRPILSHDKTEITYKFVDKSKNGPMRTVTTKVKGWPATIFLTVDKSHNQEFSTRNFTVSPSVEKQKIYAGQEVIDNKDSEPWEYDEDTKIKAQTKELIYLIKEAVLKDNIKVLTPFQNLRCIFDLKNNIQIRDMRDYNHYKQLIKGFTLLHLFQRPISTIKGKNYVLAGLNDVIQAKEVYEQIKETTKTNTDQKILDFYRDILTQNPGLTVEELTQKYNDNNIGNPLSNDTIWKYLKRLTKINYAEQKKGEKTDKRKGTYYPLENLEKDRKEENQLDLTVFLKNDFENWLETNLRKGVVFDSKTKKITELTPEDYIVSDCPLSIEDVKKLVFCELENKEEKTLVSKPETTIKQEIKPKNKCFDKNQLDSTKSEEKPTFYVKEIKPGEKCDGCGKLCVNREVLTPYKETLRRCENCVKDLERKFSAAEFKLACADLPDYEEGF